MARGARLGALGPSTGSSSGPVPSRSPSVCATRSTARSVPDEPIRSFSARWISAARHVGNARLSSESTYFPSVSR